MKEGDQALNIGRVLNWHICTFTLYQWTKRTNKKGKFTQSVLVPFCVEYIKLQSWFVNFNLIYSLILGISIFFFSQSMQFVLTVETVSTKDAVKSSCNDCLSRQIAEGVLIRRCEGTILNDKSAWHQPALWAGRSELTRE